MQREMSPPATGDMMKISPPPQPRSSISSISALFASPPYSSMFFHPPSDSPATPASRPTTFNTRAATPSATATAAAAVNSLSRVLSEHRDLLNRHSFCLSQLHKTFKEVETLRQENTNLRVANFELNNELNILLQAASFQSHYQTAAHCGDELKLQEISVAGGGSWKEGFSDAESPTSVIQKEGTETQKPVADPDRVTLPKSISVRSNGYLKTSPDGAGAQGPSESSSESARGGSTKVQSVSPASGPQKVYVRGGNNKDGPIELEVFNQGMFKTELCNKWQETGNCPYGDHCQFAHGIKELRPVIRHPRYKTEVCRMVLAGDPCPYEHRCHFRHALTEQEKLMLPQRFE